MRIFISYRRKTDAPAAAQIRRALAAAGAEDDVFLDAQSLAAGDPFPDRIRAAIEGAKLFVLLVGPYWRMSVEEREPEKDFVRRELAIARAAGVSIYPVYLGDEPDLTEETAPAGLEHLVGLHRDRVDYEDIDAAFDRVAARIVARVSEAERRAPRERAELEAKHYGPLTQAQLDHPDLITRDARFDPERGLVLRPIVDDPAQPMSAVFRTFASFGVLLVAIIAALSVFGIFYQGSIALGLIGGTDDLNMVGRWTLLGLTFAGFTLGGWWAANRWLRVEGKWWRVGSDKRVYKFHFRRKKAYVLYYSGESTLEVDGTRRIRRPDKFEPLDWDTVTSEFDSQTRLQLRLWRIGDAFVAGVGMHALADPEDGREDEFFRRIALSKRKSTEVEAVRPVYEFAQGLAASMAYARLDWPAEYRGAHRVDDASG